MQPETVAEVVVAASPSFELWIARTFIFLPAIMVLFSTGAAVAIVHNYIRIWKRDGFNDVSSNVWVALLVSTMLNLIMFAVMDVGQALVILTEGWGALVGICSTVLLPLLGYKAVTKITSPKGGTTETTSTETISSSSTVRNEDQSPKPPNPVQPPPNQ